MAKTSPEKRDLAAQRLAMGRPADEVARTIGVNAATIRSWRRNDPEFRRLLERYEGAMYGRGLELAARRGVRITVKGKPGTPALEMFRGALIDMARKDSRRTGGGLINNQEES